MTMMACGAAEKISVNPTIEKYAATEDIASAESNNIMANIIDRINRLQSDAVC